MDPRRAYMELVALDKQLLDQLRTNPLDAKDANALRCRLMDAATRLVDSHPSFAAKKEVEQVLWKPCIYRRIEDFRRRIRKYAAAAQADRNVREHFAHVSSEFQQFLTEAAAFYTHLKDAYASWLLRNRLLEPKDDSEAILRCRQSLHRCYIFLGDLARYRELHNQKAKKNFAQAEALYYRALAVLPDNGNPHNQLAVLATYVESETVAVYRYCRSLMTSQPFTTAEENLALLFERSRQRSFATPIQLKSASPSSKEKSALLQSYLHRLTRMHGILFALSSPRGSPLASSGRQNRKAIKPIYPREMEAVLFKDMQTLLHAGGLGDALLLKIVVINIFCVLRASGSDSPLKDALRLSICTITSVMEILLASLEAHTNDKSSRNSVISAFRLAGPVAVFCDFLQLHPDILESFKQLTAHRQKKLYRDAATSDQETSTDQFALAFIETLAKLVNHARVRELYAPLIESSRQQNNDGVTNRQYLLKESLELRGFTPLEQDGHNAYKPDEWALQTSTTEANSTVAPLIDPEAAKVRAWKLYHFTSFLCADYDGNPMLFRSVSGLFTTKPDAGKVITHLGNGTSEGFASLNLRLERIKNQPPQRASGNNTFSGTSLDEDDDFEDEVIVFQPSLGIRGTIKNESAKQHRDFSIGAFSPLQKDAVGGTLNFRTSGQTLAAEDQGLGSFNNQSNAFGGGNTSFGASLGYPSFSTFSDATNGFSQPVRSGWGNSTGRMLGDRTDQDLSTSFSSSDGQNFDYRTVCGDTNGSETFVSGSNHESESQPSAAMAVLEAIERESALYQQRASSLSSFLDSSMPFTQNEGQTPLPPRIPKRPPPGFAVDSMSTQQRQHTSNSQFKS